MRKKNIASSDHFTAVIEKVNTSVDVFGCWASQEVVGFKWGHCKLEASVCQGELQKRFQHTRQTR